MSVALLSIGNELLRGEIVNTNGQWLAAQLTELGLDVDSIETTADDRQTLTSTLHRLAADHAVVIATGGLGPTTDDLTADAVADALGVKLSTNDDALAAIRRRVTAQGRDMRPGHHKQANLPAGSEPLMNQEGTAPGFVVELNGCSAFFLPGVPREMEAMFSSHVAPRIKGNATSAVFHICLHTVGRGESWLDEQLTGIEEKHPGIVVRYRAKSAEVDVRIEAKGTDPAETRSVARMAAADVRERLGDCVYAEGDQTMQQLAGRSVRKRGWRLAVAESCTGGLIAQLLTSQPASDFFVGAAVTYANAAKTQLLGVSKDTLRGHGAVSAEVAAEMAEGARRAFECDVAISVTGIAGPTGATADKPLGLCHWAVATPTETVCEHRVFSGSRNKVQHKAAHAVLDLMRRTLNAAIPERPSRASSETLSG